MTQPRPNSGPLLVILLAACGTGEAPNADGARASDGSPTSHDSHALHASGDVAAGGASEATTTLATSSTRAVADALPTALVYKTPSCGCCNLWVDHMREAGFEVDARNLNDLIPVKIDAGVPPRMSSCHTALIDGYVVEGHIPAEHVKRLLEERPDVVGIAVPGMPIGSPGMEGIGARPYQVLSWDRDGNMEVYAEVDPRR